MDTTTTREISLQNSHISHRSQELKQQLMTYGQLGHLPTREKVLANIAALRISLDEVEHLLSVPRYPGDTFGEKA